MRWGTGRRGVVLILGAWLTGCGLLIDMSGFSGGTPPDEAGVEASIGTDTGTAPVDAAVDADADAEPTYRDRVLADGPIAFYLLADSTQTAKDEVGNHPGTVTASVQLGQVGPGAGTGAMRFPGGSARVMANSVAQLPAGTFASYTIELFLSSEVPAGSSQFFVAFTASNGGGGPVLFIDDQSRGLKYVAHGTVVTSSAGFLTSAWHHVAVTSTGTTVSTYVDGVFDVSGTVANPTPERGAFTIGANHSTVDGGGVYGTGYTGRLAMVAIYNKALSAQQIAAHYAARPR